MGKLKQKLKKAFLVGSFLLGSAIADLSLNKKEIYAQEPNPICSSEKDTKKSALKLDEQKTDDEEYEKELKESQKLPEQRFELKLDSLLDPYSTSTNCISTNRAVHKSLDYLVKESSYTDNAAVRFLKLATLDSFNTYYWVALNHENGHAFRAKEFGLRPSIHMCLFTPWFTKKDPLTRLIGPSPYSDGALTYDERDYCFKEAMFFIGGLDADLVLINKLVNDSMLKGKMSYYDSLMYLIDKFHLACMFSEFPDVAEDPDMVDATNDVQCHAWYQYVCFGKRITQSNVSSGFFWNLLDPMLWISGVNALGYVAEGRREIKLPKVMVSPDYCITPYGTESTLNFYYRNDKELLTKIYGRIGKGNNYGLGVKLMNIPLKKEDLTLDAGIDLWHQEWPTEFKGVLAQIWPGQDLRIKRYGGNGIKANIELKKRIGGNKFLNFGISGKTSGYTIGDHFDKGINVYLGGEFKF